MDSAFQVPTLGEAAVLSVRLLLAAVLGGMLGLERQLTHKPAGLRTHMLVSLGAALFMLASRQVGMTDGDLSRVVQGIATGIGFVGAGAILKSPDEHHVKGLTTAASVWLTAAVGMAVGAGVLWIPILGVLLALVILAGLGRIEQRMERSL